MVDVKRLGRNKRVFMLIYGFVLCGYLCLTTNKLIINKPRFNIYNWSLSIKQSSSTLLLTRSIKVTMRSDVSPSGKGFFFIKLWPLNWGSIIFVQLKVLNLCTLSMICRLYLISRVEQAISVMNNRCKSQQAEISDASNTANIFQRINARNFNAEVLKIRRTSHIRRTP